MRIPEVSVIIPTYNRAYCIHTAIDSVLQQSFTNFELLIINDGSTDDTSTLLTKYQQLDSRIRVINMQVNAGATAARNIGIKASKGMYIAFQDSDDHWSPTKLAKQLEVFKTSSLKPGVVYCQISRDDGVQTKTSPNTSRELNGNILSTLVYENTIGTPSAMVEKNLLNLVNGFNEKLKRSQDWDLFLRLSVITKFQMINEPLVQSKVLADSLSKNTAEKSRSLSEILNTNSSLFDKFPKAKIYQHIRLIRNASLNFQLKMAITESIQTLRLLEAKSEKLYTLNQFLKLPYSIFCGLIFLALRKFRMSNIQRPKNYARTVDKSD
jgi:glycosyltransferase involved in cell wall biosynthesis